MRKMNVFLSALLSLSLTIPSFSNVVAEEDITYTPGYTISENTDFPDSDAKYQVEFVYDGAEDVKSVSLIGNFTFYSADQEEAYVNGDSITYTTPYEYKDGMFTTGYAVSEYNYVELAMKEVDYEEYEITIPLPAGMYFYGFSVTTYTGTTIVKDPANLPFEYDGKDAGWSLINVGERSDLTDDGQYAYPRTDGKEGTVEYKTYTAYDGSTQSLGIYTPYGYDSSKTYKTLYLSHGGGGNEVEWFNIGAAKNIMDNLIAEGEVEPTIVVTMNNTYWNFEKGDATNNLVNNIIPFIEENYSVSTAQQDRAVAGLSSGAATTADALLQATDTFGYYGVWSPSRTAGFGKAADYTDCQVTDEQLEKIANVNYVYCSVGIFDSMVRRSATQQVKDVVETVNENTCMVWKNGAHDWNVWRYQLADFAKNYLWEYDDDKINYPEGVTVEEADNNAGYQATFVVDSSKLEGDIVSIQVGGGFQFIDASEDHLYLEQGGSGANIHVYTAYEYEDGMYPTGSAVNKERTDLSYNGSYVLYDMEESNGIYYVTLPLPATEYFYAYYITYADGSVAKIEDPANLPIANGDSDPSWSYFFVGDSSTALEGQEEIYANEKAGTWSFVEYPASDGTMQPLGIYLPYGYSKDKTYNVLYLSHGAGGNETEWLQLGAAANIFDNLIAEGEVLDTIVVTVDNSYWKTGFTVESHQVIVDEVIDYIIPFMEENYSVSTEASGRAYAGLSAGGCATASVLQRAPEYFDYYGIISAACSEDWSNETIEAMKDGKTIFVTAGTVDFGLTGSMLSVDGLTAKFDDAGIEYYGTFIQNGSHDWNVWRSGLTQFARDYLWCNEEEADTSSYIPGVTVNDHDATFVYKDDNTDILKVELYGGFQFNKEGDTTGYSAFEYEDGMYPVGYVYDNSTYLHYTMDKIGTDTYTITLPLPSNEYFYKYEITYKDGTTEQIYDPANMPLKNIDSDANWSLFYVGNAEDASEGQEYIYARDDQNGTLTFVTYTAIDGSEQPLGIYLPYGYDESKEYKVLYLSHGGWGNEVEWDTIGSAVNIFDNLIAEGEVEPTIVVTMDNDALDFFTDTPINNLIECIIPYMEANYSVVKDASGRAVAGLSAGGTYAAKAIAYYNEYFDYYGVWSPRDTVVAPLIEDGTVDPTGFDHAVYYIGVGCQDIELRQSQEQLLYDTLTKLGCDASFDYVNGEHDWYVWRNLLTNFAKDYLWTKEESVEPEVTPDTPNTGIYNNILYAAGAAIALSAVAYVALKKKKEDNE